MIVYPYCSVIFKNYYILIILQITCIADLNFNFVFMFVSIYKMTFTALKFSAIKVYFVYRFFRHFLFSSFISVKISPRKHLDKLFFKIVKSVYKNTFIHFKIAYSVTFSSVIHDKTIFTCWHIFSCAVPNQVRKICFK